MRTFFLFVVLAALTFSSTARAQSVQDELSADLAAEFDKVIGLAEAVPADHYDWRPAEGIRSFREVFLHVSSGAYFFLNMGGVSIPDGVDVQGAEQNITEKEEVVAFIREAKEHAVDQVSDMSDDALGQSVEWFDGSNRSARHLLITLVSHTSEHVGQLIAYSRMNDITPPWSE